MSAIVSRTDAGVVHRADDGGLALFDAAAGDQAVHRRRDDDLIQVVARRRQARLFLLDALLVCFDVLRRAASEIRLANGDLVLRSLEVLLRRQSFLPEVLLTLQVLARELEVRARLARRTCAPCSRDDWAAATLASPRCSCPSSDRGSISSRNCPAFTRWPSSTATRVTRPGSVGRDVDLTLRLHLAGGRDDRFQVACTQCLGLNIEAGVATVIQIGRDNRGTNQDDPQNDENLLSCHYRSPRNRT